MNACLNSQFSYCPLIWMCHSHSRTVLFLFIVGKLNLWLLKSFVIVDTYHQLFWIIFSGKSMIVGITWDKFQNFQDRWLSQYTMEEKVFHFELRKYGTYCQMIENTLINYKLFRIKLRNWKMKIVLTGSVKITLTKKKKAWDIQVILLELWLLLSSIFVLPIGTSFFFFIFLTIYF